MKIPKVFIGSDHNKAVRINKVYYNGKCYNLDTEDKKEEDDKGITKVIKDYSTDKEKDTNDE